MPPEPPRNPAGLCATCQHARRVESGRGSVFLMCARSKDDPRFPKYPGLPVVHCIGYEMRPDDRRPPTDDNQPV